MSLPLPLVAAMAVLEIAAVAGTRKTRRSVVRKERAAVFKKRLAREVRAKAVVAARELLTQQVREREPLEYGPRIFIAEFLGFDPWNS